MADTVSVLQLADTTGVKYVTKLTNISDGTGESLVEKITAADETFMTADGNRKSHDHKLLILIRRVQTTSPITFIFAVTQIVKGDNMYSPICSCTRGVLACLLY